MCARLATSMRGYGDMGEDHAALLKHTLLNLTTDGKGVDKIEIVEEIDDAIGVKVGTWGQ